MLRGVSYGSAPDASGGRGVRREAAAQDGNRVSSDLDGTWERWRAGLCPCCGMAVIEHCDGTMPQALGEGVLICGRCVANEHMRDGFGDLILASLVMKA